jgi:hypothetical protein
MLQICEDVTGKPDENGKIFTSCWAADSNGIIKVKDSKKDEWQSRLDVLKERTKYWIDNSAEKPLEIEYLFYGTDTTLAT